MEAKSLKKKWEANGENLFYMDVKEFIQEF